MKEQVKQFEDWKLIKEFLGWESVKRTSITNQDSIWFEVLDENKKRFSDSTEIKEEAWKEAYQDFKEHSFEYWEDWNILMKLVAEINTHISKNSPQYSGIVIYGNRVWIDSQPTCSSIYLGNQSRLPKHKTQETLLLCAYEICLKYLKIIK